MSRFLSAAALSLAALALPALGHAESLQLGDGNGVHQHDGFFLQMQYGAGYQSLSQDGVDLTLSGPGGAFNLAIGGAPSTNFVIFGEVFGQSAVAPTLEYRGEELESDSDVSLNFVGMGPGAALYFGESWFVSGTVAFAKATLEGPGGKADATGVGVRLGLGKEWWVSDQWGLGLAGNYYSAAVSDEDGYDLSSSNFTLSFSATYN